MASAVSERETFDIVKLIEKNPITRLSSNYQDKFLDKIKEKFTDTQQQLFVTSFYAFLNYDSKKDFVINFDDVWKWTGFSRKDHAKRLLEKFFTKDIDYKILCDNIPAPLLGGAGMNKETILLNIMTFKKFCMKSGTKKADEIHDYYINLEEILQETLNERNNELEKEMIKVKERLDNFANRFKGKEKIGGLVYVGQNPFDNDSFKVGSTTNINCRVSTLSTGNAKYFVMKKTWYTNFYKQIEDAIKQKFSKYKVTGKKEFYHIQYYDEIESCIGKMVETFSQFEDTQHIVEPVKRTIKNPSLELEKSCTKCNLVKPLEDFFPAIEHVDGRQNRCKECVKTFQTEYIENKRKTEEIPLEKQCSHCKLIKSLDQYYTDNNLFDKKGTKCKDCVRIVYTREKKEEEIKKITEYQCSKCKVVKSIEQFHSLPRSLTGHKYTCKECELEKARERYYKHREETLNGGLSEQEKEQKRIEGRKKTIQESNQRRKEIVITCSCGLVTNELNIKRHQQTAKHKNAMSVKKE